MENSKTNDTPSHRQALMTLLQTINDVAKNSWNVRQINRAQSSQHLAALSHQLLWCIQRNTVI